MRLRTPIVTTLLLATAVWPLGLAGPSSAATPQGTTARRLASLDRKQGWPPPPDAIVHVSSKTSGAPATPQPQQLWSAYAVPADMDLVVTNASILGESMSLVGRRNGEAQPVLRDSPLDPGAPLGWVYPAGSQVILQNEAAQTLPLEYTLVGYLVPVR